MGTSPSAQLLGAFTRCGRRAEPRELRELIGVELPAAELRRLARVDALLRLAAERSREESGLVGVLDRDSH